MSISEVVHVQLRETRGTSQARRMRAQGMTPAVLYGHGEQTVSLSIPTEEISALLRHGGRVLELQGAASGNALVREVQWDAFGARVLHLDLTRVSRGETVETTIPIELRGDAPGTHDGGVLQHFLHELRIKCPVADLPERLRVNVNHLELGGQITVAELELPARVQAVADPEAVVVQCTAAVAAEVEVEVVAEAAEPEVIGRKESAEEEAED
jgi:large subunit ribosomal protein L25